MQLRFATFCAAAVLAACASTNESGSPAIAAPTTAAPRVESPTPSTPAPSPASQSATSAKFSVLRVGMSASEVNAILARKPDAYHTYESGKRWIPFYFGRDAVRLQAQYKGEGCLIFSAGLRFQSHGVDWNEFSGTLVEITIDPGATCYKP